MQNVNQMTTNELLIEVNKIWIKTNKNTKLTIQKNDFHELFILNINHLHTGHFITCLCQRNLTETQLIEFLTRLIFIFNIK